jgi:hypothetical protein
LLDTILVSPSQVNLDCARNVDPVVLERYILLYLLVVRVNYMKRLSYLSCHYLEKAKAQEQAQGLKGEDS